MIVYILLALSLLLIYIINNRNRNYWTKKNVKQVNGSGWKFLLGLVSLPQLFKDIYEKYDDEHIGVLIGSTPTLVLKNIEDIKTVCVGDFQSFHGRGVKINDDDLLSNNMLFINDLPRWKMLRQKLSPVFTTLRLKTMFGIIEKCAKDLVKLVENNKGMVERKPFDAMHTYTASCLGAALFSVETKGDTVMGTPFLHKLIKTVQPSFKSNVSFILANFFPSPYKALNLNIFDNEDFFINALKRVFHNRHSSTKIYDFIDVCLELQKNGTMKDSTTGYELEPTDELFAAQAFIFVLAGGDTSANVMHFTLLELASNPKILAKVHKEIDNVLHGKDGITFEDLDKFEYLEMVLNESMRKYPNIGFLQRVCTKDTILPSNNLKIEKDTMIIIPTFGIQRDEKFYPNPELFDPERFAPDNVNNIHKYSFLPFGEGNRICIGARFARIKVKTGIAWLLRHFTLEEMIYKPNFENSSFSVRDTKAKYRFIPRHF